jgi:hypothetical protein
MRPMHNDIGIVSMDRLGRLIGVGEDEHDYYYIVVECGGRTIWSSAVGSFDTLKGVLPLPRYESLDYVFALNNSARTEEFRVVTHEVAK